MSLVVRGWRWELWRMLSLMRMLSRRNVSCFKMLGADMEKSKKGELTLYFIFLKRPPTDGIFD